MGVESKEQQTRGIRLAKHEVDKSESEYVSVVAVCGRRRILGTYKATEALEEMLMWIDDWFGIIGCHWRIDKFAEHC